METKKRLPLIVWENVCIPKGKGGLGFWRLSFMNELLMVKLIWRWHKEEGEWRNIWDFKYNWDDFDFKHFLLSNSNQGGSQIWKNAQKFKHILRKEVKWKAGNGMKILFWEHTWILDYSLCEDPRWNGLMEQ